MPRRSILSAAERESLLALPDARDELNMHCTGRARDPDRIEHGHQVCDIRALPSRDQQPQRAALTIAIQMDLRGQPAARTPEPLIMRMPLFSALAGRLRAPVALRCALTWVALSAAPSQSMSSLASAWAWRVFAGSDIYVK